ncbi:hypothetical protein MPL3356_340201 [Mesorhizobium plurifarium]|uniref:Uncharacterized protein n=1 Tax=Mesorhizobium plurifarium TaxID=69974 RepID=A0A090DVW8_MESPL|nr:hypothetical protein MPL3356_340201 [Mesorhizobium plurifarium]
MVEGQGGRIALVMIGFLARDGLKSALGSDTVVFVSGGHDVHGKAQPLNLSRSKRRCRRAWRLRLGICGLRLFRNPAIRRMSSSP